MSPDELRFWSVIGYTSTSHRRIHVEVWGEILHLGPWPQRSIASLAVRSRSYLSQFFLLSAEPLRREDPVASGSASSQWSDRLWTAMNPYPC